MKIDVEPKMRFAVCEMFRRRAAWLRQAATSRTMSALRQEMEEEAAWLEKNADTYMDYAEAAEKLANVIPDRRIDIDQVDAPTKRES